MFLHADSKDSHQTGQMHRLIEAFAGRKGHFVGFVMRCLDFDIKSKIFALDNNKYSDNMFGQQDKPQQQFM